MQGLSKWMMVLLLILFCLVGTCLIRIGIISYETERIKSKVEFNRRTPSGYITNKIRTHDLTKPMEVRNKEGHQVLILTNEEDGMVYETWIYCLDHQLYEAYVEKGSNLNLEAGFALMELESLNFRQEKECLKIDLESIEHKKYELMFGGGY